MTSNQIKSLVAVLLLITAIIGGLYLSGWILLFWLKMPQVPLELDTYWKYFKAIDTPRVLPFAQKIKVSGVAGFGLPLTGFLLVLYGMFKSQPQATHGNQKFASARDLAAKKMFDNSPTGVPIGRMNNKIICVKDQQFIVLAAPTRSGKGISTAIPALLMFEHSIVALDIKQENFDKTSGYRQKVMKHDVFLFNPFAEDGCTHRWNPLTYVSRDPAFRVSDLMSISAMLYPDGDASQKFWVSQSRNAFLAFTLYIMEQRQQRGAFSKVAQASTPCTLGGVYRLSSGDGSDLKAYLKALAAEPHLSTDCQTAFANLLSQSDDTFSSIMGSFREPLNMWISPIVDAATSADDFLLTDLRKKKMTIYIGILPNKLAESRLIINLFFSQVLNLNTQELPQNNPDLKFQCLLLMDEFTSIGKVEILASAVSYMAGYNIRLLTIIQSLSQLDSVYGKDNARTLMTNHAVQIVFTPREQRDANDYSEMLGYTTVKKRNRTTGRDTNSYSEHEERRALMLPQELKALSFDKEVFFCEGLANPVLCDKIKYYEDEFFTQRLRPAVEVRKLNIINKR